MTQPMPVADHMEVHRRAMKISDEDALNLWALITLDAPGFAEYTRLQASLKVRQFRSRQGVSWMYNGQEWPQDTPERQGLLKPGERIWVPLIVAKYGVRNTAKWEYLTDDAGNTINRQDYNGPTVPIIHILEIRTPGDFGSQQAAAALAAPRLALCTLCGNEFPPEDLANHMLTDHRAELVAAAGGKAAAPSAKTKAQVDEWAKQRASLQESE